MYKKNVRDLGKLIVAKGFKKLPKVQKIAKFGHTDCNHPLPTFFPNVYPQLINPILARGCWTLRDIKVFRIALKSKSVPGVFD